MKHSSSSRLPSLRLVTLFLVLSTMVSTGSGCSDSPSDDDGSGDDDITDADGDDTSSNGDDDITQPGDDDGGIGDDDTGPTGDDDSTAGDDDTGPTGDDDVTAGDDDASTNGDDDASANGDDDASAGDDDASAGDDDASANEDDDVSPTPPVDLDGDGFPVSEDCDDTRAAVYPGAPEICNDLDDACDGQIDEGVKTTYFQDADGDGYGTSSVTTQACATPSGYVKDATDCDDSRASVHPGAQETADGLDNDCNGLVDDAPIHWSRHYGDTSDQSCYVVTTDASDNVYLSTYISGVIDFGNGKLSSVSDGIALAMLNPLGTAIWSRSYPPGGHQYPLGLGVNADGNLFVAGSFEYTLKFGAPAPTLTSQGSDDFFSAGLTGTGSSIWAKSFGSSSSFQKFTSLALDRQGNPVMAGWLSGAANFGGSDLNGNNVDIVVVKLDKATGAHVWSRSYGDGNLQGAHGVAIDAAGNVIVAGYLNGSVDFGAGAIGGGGSNIFLLKLNASGTLIWAKAFSSTSSELKRHRVAVDSSGNIYLAGPKLGSVNFGGGSLPTVGGYDAYLAKFDPDGAHVWSKSFGDAQDQWIDDITVDASDNVLVVGSFLGTMNLGGGALSSMGGDEFGGDVFLARFSSKGNQLFAQRYGDSAQQFAQSVVVNKAGAVLISGSFKGSIDFGDGVMTSAGGTDIFVARLNLP